MSSNKFPGPIRQAYCGSVLTEPQISKAIVIYPHNPGTLPVPTSGEVRTQESPYLLLLTEELRNCCWNDQMKHGK